MPHRSRVVLLSLCLLAACIPEFDKLCAEKRILFCDEALAAADDAKEVMIIGGEGIYKEFLPVANRIYLTVIDRELEGDAFFPEINIAEWDERVNEQHDPDEKNSYGYRFITFEKK